MKCCKISLMLKAGIIAGQQNSLKQAALEAKSSQEPDSNYRSV